MSSKNNKHAILSALTALSLLPNISPDAVAILKELKSAVIMRDVSEAEITQIQEAIEKLGLPQANLDKSGIQLAEGYRDTFYQDRYADTNYSDHYKDNVGYRDGTAN